jgi:hypothetical protein
VRLLKEEMAGRLKARGFDGAAGQMESKGVDWSEQIYIETLDILSNGRIKEHDLIEIP